MLEEARQIRLKALPFELMTEDDLQFLRNIGVINGVGPEKYGRFARAIMTYLFSFLDFERHDVGFWQQVGFERANWGILKYSFISLADDYRNICKQGFKKLYLIPKYYILLIPKVFIILLGYNAVSSKAGFEAYNMAK